MRYISFFLLVLLLSCRVDDDNAIGPERNANAIIYESNIYLDGCELYLQLDSGTVPNLGTKYKVTSASLPLVRQVLTKASLDPGEMVYLPVTIRYRETTNKSVILCGFSYNPTVTEIKILEINRR